MTIYIQLWEQIYISLKTGAVCIFVLTNGELLFFSQVLNTIQLKLRGEKH